MNSQRILLPVTTIRKGDVMQTPEAVAAMRRLYELGWGVRRIAGELGCSRNTVKRHLRQGGWAPYRSPTRRRTLGGLDDWLAASFRQHRGNADVVRQELARVHGVVVSLRTVERAVRGWRQALEAEARATVRFETPPGRQLQIDFGTTTVRISGEPLVIRLFVATLGYSRRAFVAVFDHERQAAWLEGLEGAFRYFGGVPEEVLLDNPRALVDAHDRATRVVVFNARFLAFARYWGFQPRACAPYRARTKGKDERGVGLRQAQRHRRPELRFLGGAGGAFEPVAANRGRRAHARHHRRATAGAVSAGGSGCPAPAERPPAVPLDPRTNPPSAG
jgi:transposase